MTTSASARTLALLEAQVGRPLEEVETPVACVDLDRLEGNLRRLQAYADAHGIAPDQRHGSHAAKAPVVIEDNVWLGNDVSVFKGVTIGRDSVVAATAVVSKSVPPGSIAAGIPARVVGSVHG